MSGNRIVTVPSGWTVLLQIIRGTAPPDRCPPMETTGGVCDFEPIIGDDVGANPAFEVPSIQESPERVRYWSGADA